MPAFPTRWLIPLLFASLLVPAIAAAEDDDDAPAATVGASANPAGTGAAATGAAGPGRPAKSAWTATYAYGTATAHEPRFEDKKLWPHLTGKEYFIQTRLPKARVLVWAKPGTTGDQRGLDPIKPANWIDADTGKPATAAIDASTDIVLPAADKRYVIDFQNAGHGHDKDGVNLTARCITIGANAQLNLPDANCSGHLWVQHGGHLTIDVTCAFVGGDQTFARNDNECIVPDACGRDRTYLCQYLQFNKATREASVEFLGHFHTGDEFQIQAGTLIVGADSVMEMGREASPYIEKNGRIVLMDNGYLGKWSNDFHCHDLDVRGGTLQAGFPDRLLTRSAQIRIGFKNYTQARFIGDTKDADGELITLSDAMQDRVTGLLLRAGSTLRTHTADPARATLVITALPVEYPLTFIRGAVGTPEYTEHMSIKKSLYAWIEKLPKGIDVSIAKGVTVEGVTFDSLRKGGLMLQDAADRDQWKHVAYGSANAGGGDQLVSAMPAGLKNNSAY